MKSNKVPVRVWHICSNRWNSAITEYALSSARALDLSGMESYFSPLIGSPGESRAKKYSLKVYSFDRFDALTGAARFLHLKSLIHPDVIIVYGGVETALAKLKSAPTLCFRFRGQEIEPGRFFEISKQKLSLSHCQKIIVPCQKIYDQYEGCGLKIPVEKVDLGIDTKVFYRQIQQPSERPECLIFGRLDPIKGHIGFINIFAELLRRWTEGDIPKPFLRIIGQEANLKIGDLLQAAVHAGLSEHDFTIEQKRVDQPHLVLSRSTIGVIPSLGSEVICRVAEEFLCCGVPIVTLSAGALGELNLADSCFHFRDFENNIDKITDIICRSWQEDAATKIKRSEDAQKLFSLEAMGVKLSSLIDGLIVHSQVK